jgi:hypothetical protein
VTFREIAGILADRCEVRVTRSAVHDFLRIRARRKQTRAAQPRSAPVTIARVSDTEANFEFDPSLPLRLGGRRE